MFSAASLYISAYPKNFYKRHLPFQDKSKENIAIAIIIFKTNSKENPE